MASVVAPTFPGTMNDKDLIFDALMDVLIADDIYFGEGAYVDEGEVESLYGTQTLVQEQLSTVLARFISNGISENSLYSLTSTGLIDGRSYGSGHWLGHWAQATFNGNLYPTRLQPGTAYETFKEEQTDNLKVLKAMLMLYNATIFTDAIGRVVLKNKDAYASTIIDIEDKDVVSFIVKRGNQEKPQIEEIDVFAGDTSQLQGIIRNRLIDFYDSKWSIETTIDQLSKYDLGLFSKIRIQNKVYAITELERDFNKDEYKVKAWLL